MAILNKTKLFFVFLLFPNVILCFQQFDQEPTYTEINPGEDVILACKVRQLRGVCLWQKNGTPIGIYPKKYEWVSSNYGDCSLMIRHVNLEHDNGYWECLVTASNYTLQDALNSKHALLVVRVQPQEPSLVFEGRHILQSTNITVDNGGAATVKCVSHYGNPPAVLKWMLGDREIQSVSPQVNTSEKDNTKTWAASSTVQIEATRERHGLNLSCYAEHETYKNKFMSIEANLNVKYAPTIHIEGIPQIDVEEGKDSVYFRCISDANPPASIIWRRNGQTEISSLQEILEIRKVHRHDSGLYTCKAQNSVGTSEELSVQLDIKYPPKVFSIAPAFFIEAKLFNSTVLECFAEANPIPTYSWIQRYQSEDTHYIKRGNMFRLPIDNVTYDHQGEYECQVTNNINGRKRIITSNVVTVKVIGKPQILNEDPFNDHFVTVRAGETASISLTICANPRPHYVTWEWGSLRLEAGVAVGRYIVEEVTNHERESCYKADLHIRSTDITDSRWYYLIVINKYGSDKYGIRLNVEGTFSGSLELNYIFAIIVIALLIIFVTCLCCYLLQSEKCCFKFKRKSKGNCKMNTMKHPSINENDSMFDSPINFRYLNGYQQDLPTLLRSVASSSIKKDTDPYPLLQHKELLAFGNKSTIDTYSKKGIDNSHNTFNKSDESNKSADLVIGQQRHQRDLFTGSLGIPDVTSHVGSVVHAFETMAASNKDTKKKSYESSYELASSVVVSPDTKNMGISKAANQTKTNSYKSNQSTNSNRSNMNNPNYKNKKVSQSLSLPVNKFENISIATQCSASGNNNNFILAEESTYQHHDRQNFNNVLRNSETGDDNYGSGTEDYRKNAYFKQPTNSAQVYASIHDIQSAKNKHDHTHLRGITDTITQDVYNKNTFFSSGQNTGIKNNNSVVDMSQQHPEITSNDEANLLRGTTISQSFIKNVKRSNRKILNKSINMNLSTGIYDTLINEPKQHFRRYITNAGTGSSSLNENKNSRIYEKIGPVNQNSQILSDDELFQRYVEYDSKSTSQNAGRRIIFKPNTKERAII